MPVIVVVADGLCVETLQAALAAGAAPALARLREEGALNTVTSVFPSVTGPAYAPFLMGRFPGPVGLPGLRWYDRTRKLARMPGHSRSYVGAEMRYVDDDLAPDAPTLFELAPSSLAAMNVIGRGLRNSQRIGRGARFILRTGITHFRGNVRGWLAIDRDIASAFVAKLADSKPSFAFLALTGIDKTSHAAGQNSALTAEALSIVNDTVAQIRAQAEQDNTWTTTHLWVVSDHGHSQIAHHEDLAQVVESWGFSTLAHPWVFRRSPEAAVMVSGNAMAHIYVGSDWISARVGREQTHSPPLC
jgi:predicted AlkP superfamily pyrophosphatase or phosphodiesterase